MIQAMSINKIIATSRTMIQNPMSMSVDLVDRFGQYALLSP